MTRTPPPALERKAAPALLEPPPTVPDTAPAPVGATVVDPDSGIVEALVAVTGVVDDVGDVLEPGCFARTLRVRQPRMVLGHDWNRPVGRTVGILELLPGDPRLPATAPDGTPWPPGAGALWVRARYLLGTRDGREAFEVARAFNTSQSFSIGYKVTAGGSYQRGGLRHITDLDVYEYSPVLHGANRYATLLSVKAGGRPVLETKSTAGAARAVRAGTGLPPVVACSVCGTPAAGVHGGLRGGERLICAGCLDTLAAALAVDLVTLDPADVAAPGRVDEAESTSEQEYEHARSADVAYDLDPHGELHPRSGRRRGWGTP